MVGRRSAFCPGSLQKGGLDGGRLLGEAILAKRSGWLEIS